MSGVAVEDAPDEASCPPGGGCAGVPGAGSPAKKRVFFRMMELSGGAPRPKGLGAKAFTLEAAYPLEGRYVRNGFSLGDFCFTVVQVEQTIFPVAHA